MYLERRQPDLSNSEAAGGPPATLGDVWSSTIDSLRLVDNSIGTINATEDAYDRRIDAIFKATGQRLDNPMRSREIDADIDAEIDAGALRMRGLSQVVQERFTANLRALAKAHPEHAEIIGAERPIREEAVALARATDQRATDVWNRSGGGPGPWAAYIAGSLVGGFQDPVNVAGLALGPWGRTGPGARGLLWMGLKTGAANATAEAGAQPWIQAWRAEAGLEHGVSHGALQVAAAFGLGFGLDATVRGAFRGIQRLRGREPRLDAAGNVEGYNPRRSEPSNLTAEQGRPPGDARVPADPETALEEAAARLPYQNPVRRAAEGDLDAADQVADALGIRGDPEVRGARAAAEVERDLAGIPPPFVDAGEGLEKLKQAILASTDSAEPMPRGADPVPPARTPTLSDEGPRPPGRVTIEGRNVAFADLPARAIGADARTFQFKGGANAQGATERLLGVERWDPLAAGRSIVFERSDGARIIADGHQRLALAKRLEQTGHEPIDLPAWVFREKDGWTPADVRALAAKKNLQEGSGTVIDAARVIRERPDIIDSSVPLSSEMMRQARNLARLSDDAFGAVLEGRVAPNHAAVVGELVEARSLHAAMIRALGEADPRNVREARHIVGDLLQVPRQEVHDILLRGAGDGLLLSERAAVLDQAIRLLKDDARIFSIVSREATRLAEVGNRIALDPSADRALRSEFVATVLQDTAARPGPLRDLLDEAARSLAGGRPVREVAADFADDVRSALERGGLSALLPEQAAPLRGRGIDEPGGPEAAAQVAELEATLQARLEANTRKLAEKNLRRWFDWQARNGREQPPLNPIAREAALEMIAGGEDVRVAIQKAKNETLREEKKLAGEDAANFEKLAKALQDGDRKSLLGDDEARVHIRAEVQMGLDYAVEPAFVAMQARALVPFVDLLPKHETTGKTIDLGVVEKIEPRAGGYDPVVKVTFRKPDGGTFFVQRPWSEFEGAGAAYLHDVGAIALFRFGGVLAGDAVEKLTLSLRGDLWHELAHAYRSNGIIDGRVWDLLVGHANRLRILDMPRAEFRRLIGEEPQTKTPAGAKVTIARSYEYEYGHLPDWVEIRNEEAVAHMLQLVYHGGLREAEVGPVRPFLEEIFNGRAQHMTRMLDGTPDYKVAAAIYVQSLEGRIAVVERAINVTSRRKMGATNDGAVEEHFVHLLWLEEKLEGLRNELADAAEHAARINNNPAPSHRGQPMFSLMGPRAARGQDLVRLDAAQTMERAGRTEAEIIRATGWFREVGGQWAQEFSDLGLKLGKKAQTVAEGRPGDPTAARMTAGEFAAHPLLWQGYPELAGLTVELRRHRNMNDVAEMRAGGLSDGRTGHVPARHASADLDRGRIAIVATTPKEAAQKFIIEVNRFISRKEGFAEGGTPASAIEAVRQISRDVDSQAAAALERLAAMGSERAGLAKLFGRTGERGQLVQELHKLRAIRAELDALSPRLAYQRLGGTVAGEAITARLGWTDEMRASFPFPSSEAVPRGRQIVARGPQRQFSTDWENDAWAELSRRAHLIDQAVAQREQKRVVTQRDTTELGRGAQDLQRQVATFERAELDAGKTSAEVAAAIEARFGFPVDPAAIAKREVWWQIDEIIKKESMASRKPVFTSEQADQLRAIYASGAIGQAEMAKRAAVVMERPSVSWGTLHRWLKDLGVEMRPSGGTFRKINMTAEQQQALRDIYDSGAQVPVMRQRASELLGRSIATDTLYDLLKDIGVSKRVMPWTPEMLADLTSDEIAQMSVRDAANVLNMRTSFADRPTTPKSVRAQRRRLEDRLQRDLSEADELGIPVDRMLEEDLGATDRIMAALKVAKECKS